MKKALSTAMIILMSCMLLVDGVQVVEVAKANFIPIAMINHVWAPENKTYTSNLLILNTSVSFFLSSTKEKWIAYSLDGNDNVTLTGSEFQIDAMWQGINITATLPALSEGSHRLDLYAQTIPASYANPDNKTVFFNINTTTPTESVSVTLISPKNESYYSNYIIVQFTSNLMDLSTSYSLDGQSNVTVGNSSLVHVATGSHSLVVYASDTAGNMGKSDTVFFSIKIPPTPTPSPIPTLSPSLSPTPTPTSTLTASLSESASALNYGNTINFTVSTDGGVSPYNFTWYVDGQVSASSSSPYFSINSLPVGSHHVYVQVNDANGNSATTLAVAFEVLPVTSPSPSVPEFPSIIILSILMASILIGTVIFKKKLGKTNIRC